MPFKVRAPRLWAARLPGLGPANQDVRVDGGLPGRLRAERQWDSKGAGHGQPGAANGGKGGIGAMHACKPSTETGM